MTLFNVNRHLKGKNCQKFKEKYLNVHKDKSQDEFDLFVNELRQKALNPDLEEEG